MRCHGNFVTAWLLTFFLGYFLTSSALANEILDDVQREKIIAAYENIIFSTPDSRLVRFQNPPVTDVNLQCLHKACDEYVDKLRNVLPRSRFNIVQREFSANDLISIVLAEKVEDISNFHGQDQIALSPGEKMIAGGSNICGSLSYRIDSKVTRLVVILNQGLPSDEAAFCTLYQILVGSGVPTKDSFEKMWAQIAGLPNATTTSLVKGIVRILSVHFFDGPTQGMTRPEFVARTEKLNLQSVIGE